MQIITTICYLASCEKEYKLDSLNNKDKFVYCSGKCYQEAFKQHSNKI